MDRRSRSSWDALEKVNRQSEEETKTNAEAAGGAAEALLCKTILLEPVRMAAPAVLLLRRWRRSSAAARTRCSLPPTGGLQLLQPAHELLGGGALLGVNRHALRDEISNLLWTGSEHAKSPS